MDRKQIQKDLLALLEDETGETYENVTEESNLTSELGLDSVDFVSLILQVENHFKIKLGTDELQNIKTVGELISLIESKLSGDQSAAAA